MRKIAYSFQVMLFLFTVVFSGVDQNPLSAGNTQTRNVLGRTFEASLHNPALLGVERAPKGGMPIPLSNLGIAAWSDKLALLPFLGGYIDEPSLLTSEVLRRSFRLEGLDPDEVSDKLTKEFKGGVRAYAGARTSLLSYASNRFSFDISTHFDEEVHVPEGPLYMIFSRDKGLLRGNALDFSDLRQEAIWATDFTISFGLPVSIPALQNFFKLRYGAGGIGVKYVMGHSILKAEMEEGTLQYKFEQNSPEIINELDVDGKLRVQTAGSGLSGSWNLDNPFAESGLPVSGHGIGIDLGGILYDNHGTMSINIQNLGVLFWMNGVRDVTYEIKKDDLDAYDIIQGIDKKREKDPRLSIFNRDEGEYLSTESDTFQDANGFVTFLPLALNFGYSYSWDFSKNPKQGLRFLSEYANAGANYQQQLSKGPGQRLIPRLSIGGEVGALRGYMPVRMGFVLGGPEKFASAIGLGFNFKYFSVNGSYKAVGSPIFIPRRGMEIATGLNFAWGMDVDSDKDAIPDKDDKCPNNSEDPDGFEDKDGCPEYDNDLDGTPDSVDNCPKIAEDKDGFEDGDGCPDYDNDGDGVPDSLDKCINEPEDKDNFNDEDGCPDYDNDGDGVTDSLDKCPNLPEDIDMFEDDDGCPDFDNDNDGVSDTLDNCMQESETFNGYKDNDGCPDTLIKPTENETKVLNTKLRAINFKTNSAELLPVSFAALDFIADFLGQYPHLRYEIQGHTDSQGADDYNLLLSAARAGTVRGYLLSKGIPDTSIISIGYGETMPIADNSTASGRALNRRVDFKIIETAEEYSILKTRQELYKEKIRGAKIKGFQY